MSAISIIVSHLNAPYGEILTEQDIADSLKNGKFVVQNEKAFSILSFLFVEVDPSLLVSCMNELQLPLKNLKSLYYYALELGHLSNSEWENYIRITYEKHHSRRNNQTSTNWAMA